MARAAQRPTKYTPERVKSILSDLAAGIPKLHAAIRAGVSDQTLLNWEAKYPEFAAGIRKAEADAVARNVALIQRAAQDGTWQAAAWWLERRHPAEFARTEKQEHSGAGGGPIPMVVRVVYDDAIDDRDDRDAAAIEGAFTELGSGQDAETGD